MGEKFFMQTLNQTPSASRLHIGIFGRRNSGKSSLINALTNQQTALVSEVAGTTTDPVQKAIELHPIGPCVLIDTAGFDDEGELGQMRIQRTEQMLSKTDLAILVITTEQTDFSMEQDWLNQLKEKQIPVLIAINKIDIKQSIPDWVSRYPHCSVSALQKQGIDTLKQQIIQSAPKNFELASITAHLVGENDLVLLVMPQDIQAPKGRLILPQVQTTRDLLDNRAIVVSVTTDKLISALQLLKCPPKLIITDSQVFHYVYKHCPKESMLTSFSVLMARYKGDIDAFLEGAKAIDKLSEQDKVLILEACSHNPLDGDIGRIKIPALLRKKVGQNLSIEVRSGNDIPEDLTPYSLVVHCGGCMFNRAYVLSRTAICKQQQVPITNYGILIAKLGGILDKIQVK